jgi:central kinetochore subunit Mal2/MCM21
MRIHRHTIPVFIPLKEYEEQYLPLQDEGYGSEQSTDGNTSMKQDLHTLVQKVRHDLVSWTRRREAIELLRDKLGLSKLEEEDAEMTDQEDENTPREDDEGSFGVRNISEVSVEARYAKIVWRDGRAGRVKISDKGMIERAVVFGEEGRVRNAERILSEGSISIQELASKLEELDRITTHNDEP